jgi:hypothetical protein
VFDQDESGGRMQLLAIDPPHEQINAVREAGSLCPATAFSLREVGAELRAKSTTTTAGVHEANWVGSVDMNASPFEMEVAA